MTLSELFSAIIGASAIYIARLIFDRRKRKAETTGAELDNESKELENVKKAVEIWEKLSKEMTIRYEVLSTELGIILEENKKLVTQVEKLENEVKCLRSENKKLTEQLKKFNDTYADKNH